jgi:hypothetical protein
MPARHGDDFRRLRTWALRRRLPFEDALGRPFAITDGTTELSTTFRAVGESERVTML